MSVASRVRELARTYLPPSFDHVPSVDAALFLCAIDHRTGYERSHRVDGRGPFEGSDLLWELGCQAERERPGTLSAAALRDASAEQVAALFATDDETVAGPDERARLWRDLAAGLISDFGGDATALLDASSGRLSGEGGLLSLLSRYQAYSDPLAKKSFLFAKIAERRDWLEVRDPESWEVSADNVLMRLALRSGLVEQGPVDWVRAATRDAFKRVAMDAGISPPILDDLLWELGREDADLLGTDGGDLREPSRPRGTSYW